MVSLELAVWGANVSIDLISNYSNIMIVTTKDAATAKASLATDGVAREVDVFGAEAYEEYGCESYFVDEYIKKNDIRNALFVDDSDKHSLKCGWVEGLKTARAC